ncbi:ABC transporter permease [Mycolicibacterium doricum]|uniref:ABC transporter permease n=1 Tax=Mycolicibacterium doricum TaxID=126673 RepID=A0A7I7VPH8_9MYCO|nr:ABC transporter permease subunit [Mycolicibacterium doricum]MCV7268683.1 ABC transporter permease subunit [Mycolicibacterium doricum]BBZ06930.1 ABC transporter permease [Mycolicibacterium doricum]
MTTTAPIAVSAHIPRVRVSTRNWPKWTLLGAWGVFLALPVVATLLYSVATVWRNQAFPDGFTLRWWIDTLSEPRVVSALLKSTWLAAVTVVIVAILVLPALYWAYVRNPRIRTVMQLCALLPFALPFVVLAYGIKRLAGASELTQPWESSVLLVVLGHVALAFPFFLWPVDGSMASAGARRLSEAAEASGASPFSTLVRVIIPNIRTGIITGSILTFATSFGEYSIARVITGNSFETLPVWQVAALDDTRGNPNGVAVMAMFTFVLMFVVSVLLARASQGEPLRLLPGIDDRAK